jgi:hypothetical protein
MQVASSIAENYFAIALFSLYQSPFIAWVIILQKFCC